MAKRRKSRNSIARRFLLSAGKPLPCKYQFGVFGGFVTAQAAFDNFLEGLCEKPEFHIDSFINRFYLCEYLLVDELAIIGLIASSEARPESAWFPRQTGVGQGGLYQTGRGR